MALTKEFYLYCIIFFGIVSLILGVISFIAKHNIGMKLRSIRARKTGKILVKFNDEARGYYEDFVPLNQGTVSLAPPWLQNSKKEEDKRIMVGVNPEHVYFDTAYGIRTINCNPRGSYFVKGNEDGIDIEQSYITGEMAESFITRALCSPDKTKGIDPKTILMISMFALVLAGLACYLAWQNGNALEQMMPLLKQVTSKGVL